MTGTDPRPANAAPQREEAQRAYRKQMRENDALIIDRLMGLLHELPRREREAVLAGASFKEEADSLREALLRLDDPFAWLAEHYPAAMREMPTAFFEAIKNAGQVLRG